MDGSKLDANMKTSKIIIAVLLLGILPGCGLLRNVHRTKDSTDSSAVTKSVTETEIKTKSKTIDEGMTLTKTVESVDTTITTRGDTVKASRSLSELERGVPIIAKTPAGEISVTYDAKTGLVTGTAVIKPQRLPVRRTRVTEVATRSSRENVTEAKIEGKETAKVEVDHSKSTNVTEKQNTGSSFWFKISMYLLAVILIFVVIRFGWKRLIGPLGWFKKLFS